MIEEINLNKTTKNLINHLTSSNEDFEWYPTTNEMIEIIHKNFIKHKLDYDKSIKDFSILDVGAGDGNFLIYFESLLPKSNEKYYGKDICTTATKYAIEKSEILIQNMHESIIIVGTDFDKQTLIDKKVDVVFSNPPYMQYKEWMIKIIKEVCSNYLYLIVPSRWKEQKEIINIIKKRNGKYTVIYSGDFLDSEYRKSRARIDIVKISFADCSDTLDPFNIWFDEHFSISADKEKEIDYENEKSTKETIKNLVKGKNLIETLEVLYTKDLSNLLSTYKQLETLDHSILKELGANLENLKTGLKLKIKNLKLLYWNELFENLDKITNRLISKMREKLLNKLQGQTNIDFTADNAYAVIIWVLKNTNIYIDDQLKYVYFEMVERENIIQYKSNKKFIEDDWRYQKHDLTHFKLDYRLVFKRYRCFSNDEYSKYEFPNNLHTNIHTFLNDICTIGKNLGFQITNKSFDFDWEPGKEIVFECSIGEFMRVRAFMNGNIHCKMNIAFMKKLNIEMARINKWVKSKKECADELNIDIQDVEKYFNCSIKLIPTNIKLLEFKGGTK